MPELFNPASMIFHEIEYLDTGFRRYEGIKQDFQDRHQQTEFSFG